MSSAYAQKAAHERNMPALRIWATGVIPGPASFVHWLPLQDVILGNNYPLGLASATIPKDSAWPGTT
jgi:hypothetical protein